jgi:hypothetical protein
MDQVNHQYGFYYAPPSANPPFWSMLARLMGVSPGQQLFVGQGAGTIGVLAWPSSPQSVLSGNITISGGAYTEVDATKNALLFVMDESAPNFGFLQAPPGNPPAWNTLATLDSTGRWSTAQKHRFRHLVSYARLDMNANVAVAASTAWTNIPWNLIQYDTDGFWNGSAFIAPYAGYYQLTANFSTYGTVTALTGVAIYSSAGGYLAVGYIPVGANAVTASTTVYLVAGDSVYFQYNNANVAITIQATQTNASIHYLGE